MVDALTANEAARPAAEAVWEIGTSLLVTVAVSAIAFGLLVFLAAWAGRADQVGDRPSPPRLALPARAARSRPAAAALAVFLALIAWAPVVAFRKPLGFLLFAILFAAGAELLRRQTLREFPMKSKQGEMK